MTMAPNWVRWWFRGATLFGVLALTPLYFGAVPAVNAEFYYGFIGTALAFQLVYWTIGGDPVRYRPLMPLAVLAKLGFFLPCLVLFIGGRLTGLTMAAASVDAVLALAFFWAWRVTPKA